MSHPDRPVPGPPGPARLSVQVDASVAPVSGYARTQSGSSPVIEAGAGTHKLCPTCLTRHPDHFRVCPQDGATLVNADELVGTTLSGTYQVVRILGEGGMGRVYEARHARIPSKRFALKTLHSEFCAEEAIVTRFYREAEAAASVKSRHVIEVYDVSRADDGRPYIVSELLEGKELGDHLIENGRMATGLAVHIVREICRGLAAVHATGVVHRDMKPENIFLTGPPEKPTAKIIDFGISRLVHKPGLTHTGMIMGTPSYMAPEQARGEHVDHRADVYAVGAILYHAVTGQRPFDRDDPSATLLAVLGEDPPRPRSLAPDLSFELEAVIQRAMAKAPAERYQTMAELDAALAPYEDGEASAAGAIVPAGAGALAPAADAGTPAEVAAARSKLIRAAAIAAAALSAGVITAIAGIERMERGGGAALPGGRAATLVLSVLAVVMVPLLIAGYLVHRRYGRNAQGMVDLSRWITSPAFLAVGAYGYASLLVRLMETVILQRAIGIAWPVWDLLLLVILLSVAVGTILTRRAEQRA